MDDAGMGGVGGWVYRKGVLEVREGFGEAVGIEELITAAGFGGGRKVEVVKELEERVAGNWLVGPVEGVQLEVLLGFGGAAGLLKEASQGEVSGTEIGGEGDGGVERIDVVGSLAEVIQSEGGAGVGGDSTAEEGNILGEFAQP